MRPRVPVLVGGLGIFAVSLIVVVGTFWAFQRASPDFKVFYGAWKLVLGGRGGDIYYGTVDRFLYAPGFAWLLAPVGLLSQPVALALWCFSKAAVVGYIVREFQPHKGERVSREQAWASLGIASWGVVFFARPLLIDFQYGQVNTFILGACVWALLGHFRRDPPTALDFLRWFALALAALAKVFPLPLLIVPWLLTQSIPRKRLRLERMGVVFGCLFMLLIPAATQGVQGTWGLMHQWYDALLAKGLPLESHNQSFAALLHHFFSGELTHVVAEGMHSVPLGHSWLSPEAIASLSIGWSLIAGGFLLAWLLSGPRRAPLTWIAVVIPLLILPSHLVWKPYLVAAIPAAILAVSAWVDESRSHRIGYSVQLIAIFSAVNLTGFDLVGHAAGAYFEAAGVMLWATIGLLILVVRGRGAGLSQPPQAIS